MEEEDGGVVKDQRGQDEFKHETEDDSTKKHAKEKEEYFVKQYNNLQHSMRHYLNCGFNLLLYGVGSKRVFVNNFVTREYGD